MLRTTPLLCRRLKFAGASFISTDHHAAWSRGVHSSMSYPYPGDASALTPDERDEELLDALRARRLADDAGLGREF
jgi:hypothetical protein